jgi:hypothetical protein
MKKNRRGTLCRSGAIFIALIVAFGLLGAGYASWTQQFDIFSAISTGGINVDVKDVALASSDGHESISFIAHKDGDIVDAVDLDVVTAANPFNAVLLFTVENNGTVPVVCAGIDKSVDSGLEAEIVEAPSRIDAGQTEFIKVRIAKGYCSDFEFSSFFRFEQALNATD